MKRNYSVFFVLLSIMFFIGSFTTFSKHKTIAEQVNPLNLESKEVILMDANSKEIVYKVNELEKRPIASMCKVMTLLLCFENINEGNLSLDEKIVVSENASKMGGSQVFLEANGEYLVKDLIKSIVVASANDSCVALAERLYGSEEAFVDKMNEKASILGMNNTCFVNCTGLPKVGQYSCALDVATMFSELIKHKEYFEFSTIWMDKIVHPKDRFTEISNTNKLVRFYQGCEGGKTGYTSQAGHCLVACAKRNNMRLICVVINSPNSKTRFNEVSTLFNFGFNNYESKLMFDSKKPLPDTIEIANGKKDFVEVSTKNDVYFFSKKNTNRNIEVVINPNKNLSAPICKNDVLGELSLYENGKLILVEEIVAIEDVGEKVYIDHISDIIKNWQIA